MVFNSPCCSNEELASTKANGSWANGNWRKVIITEDTVHQALHLDDAESINCLPNEEIFAELARMRYEKPVTKLTFYKAFFSAQWKFLIHTILQCMSAKRTAWNEFSSSMASAIICLATGRNFNFSKYIFDSLVRNVDSSSMFYMYPRFLQPIIAAQVGDLPSHTTKYTSYALTQKVFANMRRVGKGFSGVDTPLFEGMLVPQQAADDAVDVVTDDVATYDVVDVAHADAEPTPPSPTPTITPPPPQELPSTSQVAPTPPPSPIAQPSPHPQQPQLSQTTTIFLDLLNTLVETCTTLTRKIKNLKQDKIAKALEITKLKQRVKKLDKKNKLKVFGLRRLRKDDEAEPAKLKEVIEVVTTAKLMTEVVTVAATTITAAIITTAPSAARRRNGVVIRDPEETATPSTIVHSEPGSKDKGKGILVEEPKPLKKQAQINQDEAYARNLEAELNKNINWDDVIEHVKRKEKEDNAVLRYQALKRKPQTEAQARKNIMVYLKIMVGFKMDFFKGMSYDDIRPIFEKYFNSYVAFLEKSEKELEEEASRALKKKTKSSKEKAAKKQNFGVDAVEDFKEYTLRDYYCWLKTYCCWYKLLLLDNAANSRLRLLKQSANVDDKMKKYH
nr:hypothetical protein [Tanacetum cinerariifolium]